MSGTRKALAFAWLAASCGLPLVLMLWYGATVFNGLPLIDDWAFLEKIRAVDMGEQSGFASIFERHNGHPSVPARLIFLGFLATGQIDLGLLRWMSLGANIASAVLAGWLLWRAAGGEGEKLGHPAVFAGIPLVAAWFLSMGHWETYSVAMCFNNAVVNVFLLGALACFDAWLRSRSKVAFGGAMALAVLATLSMTPGMLVWLVLALMAFIHPDRAKLRTVIIVLLGVFAVTLVWNVLAILATPSPPGKHFLRVLAAPFVLLGGAMFGLIRNQAVTELVGAAGLVAAVFVAWALVAFVRMPAQDKVRAAPFIALMVYGAGVIALIAWGRQMFPLPAAAASRYAVMSLPVLIGALGVLCLTVRVSNLSRGALGGLIGVALTGWLITNQQESVMAPFRAHLMNELAVKLRDPAAPRTTEWYSSTFFLDGQFGPMAQRVTPWMEQRRLSIFADKVTPS